jgi:hypothetical protein
MLLTAGSSTLEQRQREAVLYDPSQNSEATALCSLEPFDSDHCHAGLATQPIDVPAPSAALAADSFACAAASAATSSPLPTARARSKRVESKKKSLRTPPGGWDFDWTEEDNAWFAATEALLEKENAAAQLPEELAVASAAVAATCTAEQTIQTTTRPQQHKRLERCDALLDVEPHGKRHKRCAPAPLRPPPA